MSKDSIAQVVPLRRLPPKLSEFSYLIPDKFHDKVRPGQVVRIPFKNRVIFGVIIKLTAKSAAFKKLKSIVDLTPVNLTNDQLKLVKYLAGLYYQSLAIIINSFLAPPPQRKVEIDKDSHDIVPNRPISFKSPPKLIKNGYMLYSSYHNLFSYLAALLKKIPSQDQVVIIVPERLHRQNLIKILSQLGIMEKSVILPAKQKKTEYLQAYQKCRQAQVVIGSETALLMPFKRLKRIIVVEAENHVFQSAEQNPRYHLADFIFYVADLYKADILLTGFSPDISLLYQVRQRQWPIITIGKSKTTLEVIDMSPESRSGSGSALAVTMQRAIEQSQGKVLLIYNRHGDARILLCQDCGWQALCDKCDKPYLFDNQKNKLFCLSCNETKDVDLSCLNCQGANLSFKGSGISKLVNQIKKEYKDRQVVPLSSRQQIDWQQIKQADIVIATNKIFSSVGLEFDMAIIVQPDLDLHLPNLHAAESLRHYIMKSKSLSNRVFIQTKDPDHYLYDTLNSVSDFYNKELDWRKRFSYPPFMDVIKIMLTEGDKSQYMAKLADLKKHFKDFQFFGPLESKLKSKYKASMIIKRPVGQGNQQLDEILMNAYTVFHVEINPYQLI